MGQAVNPFVYRLGVSSCWPMRYSFFFGSLDFFYSRISCLTPILDEYLSIYFYDVEFNFFKPIDSEWAFTYSHSELRIFSSEVRFSVYFFTPLQQSLLIRSSKAYIPTLYKRTRKLGSLIHGYIKNQRKFFFSSQASFFVNVLKNQYIHHLFVSRFNYFLESLTQELFLFFGRFLRSTFRSPFFVTYHALQSYWLYSSFIARNMSLRILDGVSPIRLMLKAFKLFNFVPRTRFLRGSALYGVEEKYKPWIRMLPIIVKASSTRKRKASSLRLKSVELLSFNRINRRFSNSKKIFLRFSIMPRKVSASELGILGFGFKAAGRFTKRQMAVYKSRRMGVIHNSDPRAAVDYAQISSRLKNGECGLKVWSASVPFIKKERTSLFSPIIYFSNPVFYRRFLPGQQFSEITSKSLSPSRKVWNVLFSFRAPRVIRTKL